MSRALPFDPIAEAERQWREHWGPGAAPSMRAVTSVMRVHQILMGRLNELLAPHGLTFPRYEALMLLLYSSRGALPLGKMGDRLQVHRTSVTNTIDGLERLGYVRRLPHEQDRRTTLAEITERGREVAERATRDLNEERFATAPLGEDELDALSDALRLIRVHAGDFEEAGRAGSPGAAGSGGPAAARAAGPGAAGSGGTAAAGAAGPAAGMRYSNYRSTEHPSHD